MNPQIQVPVLSKNNKIIIISSVVIFILSSVLAKSANISLDSLLSLSLSGLLNGKVWSLFTFAFTPQGLSGALFGSLIIWFIGSELERLWGPKRYLSYILSIVLGGALIFLLVSVLLGQTAFPFVAYSGLGGAMCVSYGVLFPERTLYLVIFPVKGKYFSLILIAMSLYSGIFSPGGILAWGQLGMYLSAFLWMFFITKKSGKKDGEKSFLKKSSKKNHLKIVH